ncbi:hypothetical protein B0H13DRAFT_2325235 [Mycena leptocephala]|nr:hypothetical protein B0H13DRAFT_2325235 [Mycena leptocephala]
MSIAPKLAAHSTRSPDEELALEGPIIFLAPSCLQWWTRVQVGAIEQRPPTRASESSPCIFSLHLFLHPVSSSTLHPFCSLRSSFSEFHSPAGSDADVDTNVERRIRHISSYNLHHPTMNLVPGGPTRAHPLHDLYRYHVSLESLPPTRCSVFSRPAFAHPIPPFTSRSISSFNLTPLNYIAPSHLIRT